jgi:transposase
MAMAKKKVTKAKKKKKNPGGRPQKVTFDEQLLSCVEAFAADGKTNKQIAEILGVSPWTIYQYKRISPEFSHRLELGKSQADELVEQAMFARATGCWGKEAKTATDKGEVTDVKYVDKWYPPDVKAGIFWLTNRQSQKWRDRVEQEVSVKQLEPVIIEDDTGATTTLTMKEGSEDGD